VIDLHAATVLLQVATGGMFFLWITTRRREVSLGYGWLMRSLYAALAGIGLVAAIGTEPWWPRDGLTIAFIVVCLGAFALSVQRRGAGVEGQREVVERRSVRVAEMTGIDRAEQRFDKSKAEYPPVLDLVAALVGLAGVIAAAVHAVDAPDATGSLWVSIARVVVGSAFLGAITDGMSLGHWYLTQPGLKRGPLLELVYWNLAIWPFELLVLLLPTGMLSVLNGTIDDKYGGYLGWYWAASSLMTLILLVMTRLALKERQYSAVMAATGLLYLAILMAFGMDVVARVLLDA